MKELIAVVATILLVALIVMQNTPQDTLQALPELPRFHVEDVTRMTIRQQGEPILEGKREENRWRLAGGDEPVYLDALVVEQLLLDLQSMKAKRIVSKKTEQFSRFSVADDEVVLQDKQGNILLDVFIGKPATDLTSTYIRLADQQLILAVDKVLTWQVKRSQDAWLATTEAKDAPAE